MGLPQAAGIRNYSSLAEHAEGAEFKTKTRKSFMANYFLIFSASSAPLREK